ncbi:hypothetical protein [Actinomadura hibisca]|uniref:hypothetical protein n=1 Tax=Actinomadura hibisca TaxID=68565 RepID=UPI00082999B1|nr:hypothetical protein [Actinomadura hibisca]
MTDIKIEGKVGGSAAAALEPHAPAIYAKRGARVLAVVELAATERTEPAPDSDKTPSVKMRIAAMEIPAREQEGAVREVMKALYVQRTAHGTINEQGEIELSKDTLRHAAGLLGEIENARLRAGAEQALRQARQVSGTTKDLSASEFRHEMRGLADLLQTVLDRAALADDSDQTAA